MKTTQIALVCIILCSYFTLFGQKKEEQAKQVLLEMRDGNTIQGQVTARHGDTLVVETATLGTLTLNTKNIKSITTLDPERLQNGQFWFENPHATRGYFAPTGFGLRKGEGYYSNIFLFINSAAYGFTDYFTIGVGADAFTIFSGNTPLMLYITPKISIPVTKNFSWGIGLLAGSFGGGFLEGQRNSAGIAYGIGTIGSRDNNATLGLGYGYAEGGWAKRPVVTLSGQYRVARKASLMTENYILPGSYFGISGARFMNARFSFDLGIIYGSIFDEPFTAIPIPFLGVAFPFGHRKVK